MDDAPSSMSRVARTAMVRGGARGAALVLAALVLTWWIDAVVGAIEHARIVAAPDDVPAFSSRATVCIVQHLVGLGLLLGAVHRATRPRVIAAVRPVLAVLAVLAFVAAGAGAVVASVWMRMQTAENVMAGTLSSVQMQWIHDTNYLALVDLGCRTTALLATFVYAAWKWRARPGAHQK